jgi:hypothetical protein
MFSEFFGAVQSQTLLRLIGADATWAALAARLEAAPFPVDRTDI